MRIAALLLALWSGLAAAQYPNKPIRLIVPFPPGGSNDIVARMLATQLAGPLGQSVVIENKGGAGGVLGSAHLANASPERQLILIISFASDYPTALFKTLLHNT